MSIDTQNFLAKSATMNRDKLKRNSEIDTEITATANP